MVADPGTVMLGMEMPLQTKNLATEVTQWADEIQSLMVSCDLLIRYFGSDDELAAWRAAIALPTRTLASAVHAMRSVDGKESWKAPEGADVFFECSESVARIVAPLVEIIGVPVAPFVQTVRQTVAKGAEGPVLFPYGAFCVRFANAISNPLWEKHVLLAPEEWKDVHIKSRDKP